MFVSSTDQSPSKNPSSSSNFLHLTKSSDELVQSHFSIRDYAFNYRTKNFKKSWPFSSTSLQLCLKHGLSDPLPPIQSPEALYLKKPNITHVETVSYKRKSEKLVSNQTLLKTKESFENDLLASGSKSNIQVAIINKNPRKKIGLIAKPGACMDSGSKEDQSCLFASSESIALRTCPICKTFLSASNTTLNAHIDQCLSVDSGEQPISKPNMRKVKPKMKMKSMVDIYAAAKGCTLEGLDKRNGTKWAMISSYTNKVVSENKPEVSNERKKLSVLLHACVDEDASGIGPVYIDDKGQKLRILSEFNKKTSDPSKERIREKKSSKEGKGNKSFRKILYYKYCKQVTQSKTLIVCKGNASEIPEYQRGSSEEGRSMERSETPGQGQYRIFNQKMQTKPRASRYGNRKGTHDSVIRYQTSENEHSLSETVVSSPLNSQNSWRICGESQVSGKSSRSPLRCSVPMKLKKARLDFSENEDEDEDKGKWESEMTQELEMTDYDEWDDNGETDKVLLSTNPSTSGEDNEYESYKETGNNKGVDYMLEKTNDADAEFESMIYEKTCCETAEQGSSFMEVDPIPIPGPPGSFLPSPWDMGTDAIETHGNSSVITSQVQSSQDQLDLTDRNSSESPVSEISNLAALETHGFHYIINIDKRPYRFRDNDQSCCCQIKDKAFEDTTFGRSPPHMIQQSNSVLRLMGKDLMVINQREEPSHDESSLNPISQQVSLSLHCLYNIP